MRKVELTIHTTSNIKFHINTELKLNTSNLNNHTKSIIDNWIENNIKNVVSYDVTIH